jgi:hypothetical protein
MFKGIAVTAFCFGLIMTAVVNVSQPGATGSIILPHTTVIKKNTLFPLKGRISVEPCAIADCADV